MMISIINQLLADTTLTGLLATFQGGAAIFPDFAPEACDRPLVIVAITESNTDTPEMQDISINVDFYHYGTSWAIARQAAKRIEFVLDRMKLQSTEYGDIRIFKFSKSPIPSDDARDIHYNCQFEARSTRDEWVTETRV
jgi:hypothetical protein